jgi:hypothetical protein
MQKRRRFKQTRSLQERLADEAKRLREEAKTLPPGHLRYALEGKARQIDTASHVSEWLRSPDLEARDRQVRDGESERS